MRIAILIANTDDSAFAKARPHDGEKFAELIHLARPDWRCDWFWIRNDAFPSDIERFDGVLITGSPASVHDGAGWIARARALVLDLIARQVPLFGACFGHQLIAEAFGAEIVRNPSGWGHGLLEVERVGDAPWLDGAPARIRLYGSHSEQADRLPEGAELLWRGEGCPVAGFRVGERVYTVQHHPEMTHQFITDLVEEHADYVGAEATEAARRSLRDKADRGVFAEGLARFFEHAAATTRRKP